MTGTQDYPIVPANSFTLSVNPRYLKCKKMENSTAWYAYRCHYKSMVYRFRPRPLVTVFVCKRNFFFVDWPSVHTYAVKTVTKNALQSGNFWKLRFRVFVWTVKTQCWIQTTPGESRAKNKPKCKMAKDTVLQKDRENRSSLSGMIHNRHFRRF